MAIRFDLETEILKEHSKQQALKIAFWIGSDKTRFAKLMQLFLHGDVRVVQRSAWIISCCADNHSALVKPWLGKMVQKMREPNVHNAVQRNVLRILQFVNIPRSLQGVVVGMCFDFLASKKIPVAIKAFSMTVLANIAQNEPDLKNEIISTIRVMIPYGSAGIQSRCKESHYFPFKE